MYPGSRCHSAQAGGACQPARALLPAGTLISQNSIAPCCLETCTPPQLLALGKPGNSASRIKYHTQHTARAWPLVQQHAHAPQPRTLCLQSARCMGAFRTERGGAGLHANRLAAPAVRHRHDFAAGRACQKRSRPSREQWAWDIHSPWATGRPASWPCAQQQRPAGARLARALQAQQGWIRGLVGQQVLAGGFAQHLSALRDVQDVVDHLRMRPCSGSHTLQMNSAGGVC